MKRCVLCGLPARHGYCHAHSWAAGTKTAPPKPKPVDEPDRHLKAVGT